MVDYLTYYCERGTEPFRTLSALPDDEAIRIMESLFVEGSVLWQRFERPAWYLEERKRTERWVRDEFVKKGGRPQAAYPVCLVLGSSPWIQRHAPAGGAEHRISLAAFGDADVSFTYPDSMISHWLGRDKPPAYFQPAYHGQVFTRAEILQIVKARGLPELGWESNLPSEMAHYIEAQVWNHDILDTYRRELVSAAPRGEAAITVAPGPLRAQA